MARAPERGASLVEYALLVALIAVVCIAAVTKLGNSASQSHQDAADGLGGGSAIAAGCEQYASGSYTSIHRGPGDNSHGTFEPGNFCFGVTAGPNHIVLGAASG